MNLVRYADRPDLADERNLSSLTFPEYMHHNVMGGLYWGRLYTDFPDYQLALLDERGEIAAEVHALGIPWDGSDAGLPSGWDEAFERGMTSDRDATVVSLLAISVHPQHQGRGLAARLIDTVRRLAADGGLTGVLAPVRPTWKHRYPLIPIEDYIGWRRADGTHFDPWIRVHERVGGEIVAPAPLSMRIEAPVASWEEWTGVPLPADGDHVVPGMLAPLVVRDGVGVHVEPNVWLRHGV